MFDLPFLIVQLLNGLQLSMLLFLLAVGLSVVFGLMNFINLAHGTLYMFGAYFAVSVAKMSGSYWGAFLLAPIGVALIGAVFYKTILVRMQQDQPMKQVLVTFAMIFIGFDAVRMIWGNFPEVVPTPDIFSGSTTIFGETYPVYRLFIIGLGLAVMLLLYLGLERTRIGAIVRAGVDDPDTVVTLGINVRRVFFWVFCLGCYLAGLAGVVAAPVFSVFPGMDMATLILALIVVIVGGPGSLKGAVLGSLIIGMVDTFGQVLIPGFASVIIYALMALILLTRPHGLVSVRTSA